MGTSGPGQQEGLTVLIKKGTYVIPRPILIDGRRITYKSLSSNRDDVVLKGKGYKGSVPAIFKIQGSRTYIQDLSLGEVANHAVQIHGEKNADHVFLRNLRFFDTREQMVKGSYDKKRPDTHTDYGLIEGCLFEFTRGYSFQSYTGGIDIHHGENWMVKNNQFRNIRTREGKLTEGAIHFWTGSKNTHILNNRIENCDRGITLGLDQTPQYGGFIRGNEIHVVKDTGIYLCNASDVFVEDNKIFVDSSYPNAIEYRFKGSRDILIRTNEANRKIVSRNGGQAIVTGNRIDPGFTLALGHPLPANQPAPPKATAPKTLPEKKTALLNNKEPVTEISPGIRVFHHRGQTFILFKEAQAPFSSPHVTYAQYHAQRKAYQKKFSYRIYRSDSPITTVKGLSPLAEIEAFSGINDHFWGLKTATKLATKKLIRYTAQKGAPPLPPGTGIYVTNPLQKGESYYAVTTVVNGREDKKIVQGINTDASPVKEIVGRGIPVLQRIERPELFNYIKNATLYFYTRWESYPNTSLEGKPFDYLVAIPEKVSKPAPVGIHMHGWGGNLKKGYAWWQNASRGSILLASNQDPYDWWTGYKEDFFDKPMKTPRVRPYTMNRLFSFLDYLKKDSQWDLDMSRTFTAGLSMGGSGSIMAAIRYPDKIAWTRSWVGVHKPDLSPQFKSSYEQVWGKPGEGLLFENGEKVWEYYDDTAYLARHPDKDIGLICFSNGKNDAGIGWKQAVLFLKALQETRQPHIFTWGQAGHGQRAAMPMDAKGHTMPIDISTKLSLPAFTNCSLDDTPGNGDPSDGAPKGQVNRWLYWETENIVDQKERWEMTMGLTKKAPAAECRVDITPRRLQRFKAAPREIVGWELRSSIGTPLDRGKVVADHWGLVTVKGIRVTQGKNRLVLFKQL